MVIDGGRCDDNVDFALGGNTVSITVVYRLWIGIESDHRAQSSQ
jgi:hypothetical protein